MALDKATLKSTIRAITDALWENPDELTPEDCREKFAADLSNAIDVFVKTGTATITIVTTGSATTQTGTGSGSIT